MFLKSCQKRLQELSACSCYNNNYSQLVCVECRMLVFEKVLPKGTFFCVQSSELETGLLSRHPETFSFFNHCVIEERERKKSQPWSMDLVWRKTFWSSSYTPLKWIKVLVILLCKIYYT